MSFPPSPLPNPHPIRCHVFGDHAGVFGAGVDNLAVSEGEQHPLAVGGYAAKAFHSITVAPAYFMGPPL